MKACADCGESKPITDYHKRVRSKDGVVTYCKPCAISRARKWYRSVGHTRRRKWTVERYGISMDSYQSMIDRQRGLCAICFEPMKPWPAIDHSHATGKVRGLLCRSCNGGLGLFKDNVKSLAQAIRYLENA